MRIKKTHFYFGIVILILLVAAVFYYFNPFNQKKSPIGQQSVEENLSWLVDDNGYLHYPAYRGQPEFQRTNYLVNESIVVSKIIYKSNGANIYGFLVLPASISTALPGVVILPGAGVSKESELNLAEEISQLGVAVLTIDQRGVGETGGYFPDLDEDYGAFLQSKEPTQHLVVYDALRGADLLRSAPFIDPKRIIIVGESFGGRVAIIAAAIDKNIKGALVISTAGSGFPEGNDASKNRFLKSIDANHYVDLIAPRPIIMMHNYNDRNIPLGYAAATFYLAQEPKSFLLVNDTTCNHGYCDSMYPGLVASLDYLVGLKKPNANLTNTAS